MLALLLAVLLCQSALANPPFDEMQLQAYAARREALLRDGKVNVPEMSLAIRSAINEAEKLAQTGAFVAAEGKLQELSKYGPIEDLPSFDVLMLDSFLAMKRGDTATQALLQNRASAIRELLWNRIGTGTQDDPIRVVMVNEITEWVRSHLGKVIESKPIMAGGRNLQALTYSGLDTGNQPRTVYFAVDPRYMVEMRLVSLFTVIPTPTPQIQRLTAIAKEKRDRFLEDTSFPFMTLQMRVRDKIKQANDLAAAGKPADGLAALREIEQIRPIEEIPSPTLLTTYSALLGRIGDFVKQTQIRDLAFGTFQAIAASGDALTPETSIEVLFVEEEYAWLRDKRLTLVQQSLVMGPPRAMDVLHAKDAQGNERDYYFNITRMQKKELQSIANHE
jgi:hypothetical protein